MKRHHSTQDLGYPVGIFNNAEPSVGEFTKRNINPYVDADLDQANRAVPFCVVVFYQYFCSFLRDKAVYDREKALEVSQ